MSRCLFLFSSHPGPGELHTYAGTIVDSIGTHRHTHTHGGKSYHILTNRTPPRPNQYVSSLVWRVRKVSSSPKPPIQPAVVGFAGTALVFFLRSIIFVSVRAQSKIRFVAFGANLSLGLGKVRVRLFVLVFLAFLLFSSFLSIRSEKEFDFRFNFRSPHSSVLLH